MWKKLIAILISTGFLWALPAGYKPGKSLGRTKDAADMNVNQTQGGVRNYISNSGSKRGRVSIDY